MNQGDARKEFRAAALAAVKRDCASATSLGIEASATFEDAMSAVMTEFAISTGQGDAWIEGGTLPKMGEQTLATLILAASNVALVAELRRIRWLKESKNE